jgi:hypothetical protein
MVRPLLISVLLLAGCGLSNLPVGVGCDDSSDCAVGLSCRGMRVASVTDACAENPVCTVGCTADSQCAAFGAGLRCEKASCDGARICVR